MKYGPYSHSRINQWKNCPRAFKYSHIDKIPKVRTPSVALDRGTLIHLIFEHHRDIVKIKSTRDFKQVIEHNLLTKTQIKECFSIYDNFMKSKTGKRLFEDCEQIFAELELGLDSNLDSCPIKSDDLFLRGYIDAGVIDKKSDTLICIDYKTGKLKTYENQDWAQLLWYSIGLFSRMPHDNIILGYAYVEHNKANLRVVKRTDIEKYKKALYDTVQKIEDDTEFNKHETGLCNYCDFQGHCMNDI